MAEENDSALKKLEARVTDIELYLDNFCFKDEEIAALKEISSKILATIELTPRETEVIGIFSEQMIRILKRCRPG